MIDLTRVRTRLGRDPHFVNVDYDYTEIGYLELNSSGEVVRAVVHEQGNEVHRKIIDQMQRLARPFIGATAACVSPRH